MKVYINLASLTIKKVEREKPIYQGSEGIDSIRVLFDEPLENSSPIITYRLPTGRIIGPIYPIGLEVGQIRLVVEEDINWYFYDFPLTTKLGLMNYPGQLEASIALNFYNESGNVVKRAVVGSVVNEIIKTTIVDGGDIFITGDAEAVIANVIDMLDVLSNRQTGIENTWTTKVSKLIPVIKNLLQDKQSYLEFSDSALRVMWDSLELVRISSTEIVIADYLKLKSGTALFKNLSVEEDIHIANKSIKELMQDLNQFNAELRGILDNIHKQYLTATEIRQDYYDKANVDALLDIEDSKIKAILNNDYLTAKAIGQAYYNKGETESIISLLANQLEENYYNKEEVNEMHEALSGLHFEIVETLPDINDRPNPKVIYLVPSPDAEPANIYEEWVVINNKWELLGTTKIDLSNYVQIQRGTGGNRGVINNAQDEISLLVEKNGNRGRLRFSDTFADFILDNGGRETKISLIEGSIFLAAPSDGAVYLSGGALFFNPNGRPNAFSMNEDGVKIDGSAAVNSSMLTESLSNYIPYGSHTITDKSVDLNFDGYIEVDNTGYLTRTQVESAYNLFKIISNNTPNGSAILSISPGEMELQCTRDENKVSKIYLNGAICKLWVYNETNDVVVTTHSNGVSISIEGNFGDLGNIQTNIIFGANGIIVERTADNEAINDFSIILPNDKRVLHEGDFEFTDTELDDLFEEAWV